MSRAGVGYDGILVVSVVVYDTLQAGPGVLDVVEVPPQVAVFYDGAEVGLEQNNNYMRQPASCQNYEVGTYN